MNEEINPDAVSDGELLPMADANKPIKQVSALKIRISHIFKPLDGMYHIGFAFILPVMIMALIYIAMEVWPFGKSSVLVLDLNGQYVYYFEALRDILRGEQGLLYSFERALGGEFLGIIAYYLASPFSILVALFPEGHITESLYTILLLKCGLSGMNMCVYLHKSHPTKPVSEVIFSVMYALTSYAVVMQHNTMWIDCLLFLPLILLGVESLIKYKKYKLYVITLAVAVFSNYYIGYMVCIAVAAYFFFYYCMCTPSERNPIGERCHFIKTLLRMMLYSAIAVGIASIIIIPAYYSLQFGKTTFSSPNFDFKQKFDFLDLIAKMYPGTYDTVRPEGLPFVFSGTITLILLPVFFIIKNITPRQKIAYGALMGFFIFSFNSTTIDLVWHGFQRPNWLNYRYSFIFCFVIIVMAYLVYEHIRELDMKVVLGTGAVLGLLICIIQKFDNEAVPDLAGVWFSIACIAVYIILLSGCRRNWLDGSIQTILCVAVLLELFCNGLLQTIALDKDVHYSSRASYMNFMNKWTPAAEWMNENDTSFYRAEKTEHRKTNDNFALNIRGLSNSTSTLNAKQIEFLERMGYSSRSHWSKYLGGTPVADSLLGIKYIMTLDSKEMNDVYGEPIYHDEKNETVIYENPYALSLGYMVNSDVVDFDMEDDKSPFDRMNKLITKLVGSETKLEIFKAYKNIKPTTENLDLSYVTGHKKYSKVNTSRSGKLIFTFTPVNDKEIFVYFPSDYRRDAKLKVNGSDVSEYFTNETCRIVSIGKQPAGEELIVSLTLDKDEIYIGNGSNYFYYLDEELFEEVMPKLQENGFIIDSFTDSSFEGKITATEDKSLFLLTIPYDEGWNVYIDGEKVETFEVLDSLTAIELTPGEHTVSMKYFPKCYTYGITISICSLALFLIILVLDFILHRRKPVIAFQTGAFKKPVLSEYDDK
ncbi:MAG: YfhO family protein [Clostridiales bacterium]|nr:YfhO family protein [Clostridiales bacterium]